MRDFKSVLRNSSVQSVLLGIGLILLRFYPFFLGKTLIFGDNYSLIVPGKLFTAQWLSQGILPLWNPLLFAGISWIGDVNQSILYPSTLLFLLFPPATALTATILLHQVITFLGMHFLTAAFVKKQHLRLLSGLLWSFSPQLAGTINNISVLQSISWMPWVVLAGYALGTRWKYVPLFAVTVLLQFAGGYPQHVLYSIAAAVVLSAWTSRNSLRTIPDASVWFRNWLTAAVAVVLITAAYWMPFLEVLRQSTRTLQTTQQAASGSLHPAELIRIVFPYFFDNPMLGMRWGLYWNMPPNVSVYISWFSLLVLSYWLFFFKKKNPDDWFFSAIIVITILFAMGENFPFFSFFQHIPVLKDMRGASTMLVLPTLFIPLWLAMVLNRISLPKRLVRASVAGFFIAGFLGFIVYIIQAFWFPALWSGLDVLVSHSLRLSAFHTLERDRIIVASFLQFFVIAATLTALSVAAYSRKKYAIFIILVALELSLMTQGQLQYGKNSLYSSADPSLTVNALLYNADLKNYRVLTRNYNAPYADFGAYYDALTVRKPFSDSYVDEAELQSFAHLQRMKSGATPDWNLTMGIPVIHGYTTLLPSSMHAEFMSPDTFEGVNMNDLPEIETSDAGLQKWSARYYIVDTWFPLYGEILPTIKVASDDRWTIYELPNVLGRFRYEDTTPIEVFDFAENPNTITFSMVNENGKDKIIVADRFDANWHVSVNGNEVPLENWQGMRRFDVPEGRITVRMWYFPLWFYRGLGISGATVLSLLIISSVHYWRSRKTSS